MLVEQEKTKDVPKLIDDIRKWCSVIVMNTSDCRTRLNNLKNKLVNEDEIRILIEALKLLDAPDNSEVRSTADYDLFSLIPKMNSRRDIVEVQELFFFINSLFEPVKQPEQQQQQKQPKPSSRKR
jgi:hypothetical protein